MSDDPNDSISSGDEHSAGSLLEILMQTRCLPARGTRPVRNQAELTLRLQQIIRLIHHDTAWRAYTDGSQWWFGACKNVARVPAGWTFETWFFAQDGTLCGAASWQFSSKEGCVLTGIIEAKLRIKMLSS